MRICWYWNLWFLMANFNILGNLNSLWRCWKHVRIFFCKMQYMKIETAEMLKWSLLFLSLLGLTFVFLFYVTSFFYLSLFNIISYMNFSIRSSETYFCCFSSESCPTVKIFQPRLCQWSIRTQTGWSCRGHLSVGPIFAGFNIPGILDKKSMYRKSKS